MPRPELPSAARLLLGLGLALWLLSALSAVWELLALQAPESPLHLGVLAGPIAQLRAYSFALGAAGCLLALLWPRLYLEGEARWIAWLLALGALLHVLALLYAAAHGLLAVQLLDPRRDARLTVYLRGFGHALTLVGLVAVSFRALTGRSE